jgi:hypothetical protein
VATPKRTKSALKGAAAAANSLNSPTPENLANAKAQEKKEEPKPVLYQPVTTLVASNDPRVLEWFARAMHPPDVVAAYMNEVFDTARLAEGTYLALQPPQEADVGDRAGEGPGPPCTPAPEAEPDRKRVAAGKRKAI